MADLNLKSEGNNSMPSKPAARAQAYGAACREIRMIWRKLDCLNPNLRKVQMSRPPERRL